MSEPRSIHALNADLFQPEEVDRSHDPIAARKKAMDYLARREYGRGELIAKLETAGFVADTAGPVVDRLAEEGLQSDERFAGGFVASRISQGKGPVRIRQELKERGLTSAEIDGALAAAEQEWTELASAVRARKFGDALPADFAEKARQMRFLQYRGFEHEQVRAAIHPRGDD